ncbi:MAG: cupin domain-containing protein [Proteobacteria bacterium]|nr:cupin domain-containing protein [Pseudomonadota bacterium]
MKQPVRESDLSWEVWYAGTDREIRGKGVCDVGGRAKVGFGILELPPGCNTRPAHYHSIEEEHLYALSGEATLHLGATLFALAPGSYVCFPAGQKHAHFIDNTGTTPFKYIMVGERISADEVVYPEAL